MIIIIIIVVHIGLKKKVQTHQMGEKTNKWMNKKKMRKYDFFFFFSTKQINKYINKLSNGQTVF